MKTAATIIVTLVMCLASILAPRSAAARGGNSQGILVNCGKGQTIQAALAKRPLDKIEIQFFGTCQEDVVIERDDVSLQGIGVAPTVVGTVEVKGASRVNIKGFLVRGVPDAPFNTAKGGINIVEGGSANVENVRIEDVKTRGFQIVGGTASIKDVTIINGLAGAFVFRSAGVIMSGSIIAENSIFGLSAVYSGVFAKTADLTFNRNLFGLIVQAGSGLEHVVGHLTANDNTVGVLLAGGGIYTYGTFIEVKRNSGYGILIDELSSMTPLVGAPGGGPAVVVADNPGIGISVERLSALELSKGGMITGNGVGLQVDNSLARIADTVIQGNLETNVILTFGAKAEFLGSTNVVTGEMKCDESALTRGSFACTSAVSPPQ